MDIGSETLIYYFQEAMQNNAHTWVIVSEALGLGRVEMFHWNCQKAKHRLIHQYGDILIFDRFKWFKI